uniref:Uncharacterized protein n=1 Tax=Rhizophagus irregularis (strain DAOM 181602 / DAOM 197198 / MUCL 43194) TaxID=747089 RepID=U9U8X4_RHIID
MNAPNFFFVYINSVTNTCSQLLPGTSIFHNVEFVKSKIIEALLPFLITFTSSNQSTSVTKLQHKNDSFVR